MTGNTDRQFVIDQLDVKGYEGAGNPQENLFFCDTVSILRDEGQVYVVDEIGQAYFEDAQNDNSENVWSSDKLPNFPILGKFPDHSFFVEFAVKESATVKEPATGCFIHLIDTELDGELSLLDNESREIVYQVVQGFIDSTARESELNSDDEIWQETFENILLMNIIEDEQLACLKEAFIKTRRLKSRWQVTIIPFLTDAQSIKPIGYDLQWHFFMDDNGKINSRFFSEPLKKIAKWKDFFSSEEAFRLQILLPCLFGWSSINSEAILNKKNRIALKENEYHSMVFRNKQFNHYEVKNPSFIEKMRYDPLSAEIIE